MSVEEERGGGAAPEDGPKRPETPVWSRVAGMAGLAAILGAFLLVSHEHVEPRGLYLGMNGAGAVGVGLLSWKRKAWVVLVLSVLWAGISVSGLWRLVV